MTCTKKWGQCGQFKEPMNNSQQAWKCFQRPKKYLGCVCKGWGGTYCADTKWVDMLFKKAKAFTECQWDSVLALYNNQVLQTKS